MNLIVLRKRSEEPVGGPPQASPEQTAVKEIERFWAEAAPDVPLDLFWRFAGQAELVRPGDLTGQVLYALELALLVRRAAVEHDRSLQIPPAGARSPQSPKPPTIAGGAGRNGAGRGLGRIGDEAEGPAKKQGRPKLTLDLDRIRSMRTQGIAWRPIAEALGTSIRSARRRWLEAVTPTDGTGMGVAKKRGGVAKLTSPPGGYPSMGARGQ